MSFVQSLILFSYQLVKQQKHQKEKRRANLFLFCVNLLFSGNDRQQSCLSISRRTETAAVACTGFLDPWACGSHRELRYRNAPISFLLSLKKLCLSLDDFKTWFGFPYPVRLNIGAFQISPFRS